MNQFFQKIKEHKLLFMLMVVLIFLGFFIVYKMYFSQIEETISNQQSFSNKGSQFNGGEINITADPPLDIGNLSKYHNHTLFINFSDKILNFDTTYVIMDSMYIFFHSNDTIVIDFNLSKANYSLLFDMKATEPGPVFLLVDYNEHTYNFITTEDFNVWRTMSLDVGETQGHQLITFTYINDSATLVGDTYVDDRNVYVRNIRSVKKS